MKPFILAILSLLSCDGWSQQNEFEDELKTYLISTGELGSDGKGTVYIANLLDGEKYGGKDGIYRFVVLGRISYPVLHTGWMVNPLSLRNIEWMMYLIGIRNT